MLQPLVMGSRYMSPMIPGPSATIELPSIPARSLNAKNVDQLGAKVQAIVKAANRGNVPMTMSRRPYSSLSGAHTIGPFKNKRLVKCQVLVVVEAYRKHILLELSTSFSQRWRGSNAPTRNIDIGRAF